MQLPPTLRASANEDGLVVMNIETGLIYTSNIVGSQIWRLIEDGKTEAEIAAHLAKTYRQSPAAMAADVREFVERLTTLGAHVVL
jgi:hypothetical protein